MNKRRKQNSFRKWRKVIDTITMPVAIILLTASGKVPPEYKTGWGRRIRLGFRFFCNYYRIESGTSWRAHLVMAMRLLETPPSVKGDVVECGCWKGGATVNLSLACALVGRHLKIYDSFEGLPPPTQGDHVANRSFSKGFIPHVFMGTVDEVKNNVRRLGSPKVCSFHKGWFEDTLPRHKTPIAMVFLDVDHYKSLHECLLYLWPHMSNGAFLFTDEYRNLPYCSVFFSEKYWRKYLDCDPPGLIGIGTGVQVGMHYYNPKIGAGHAHLHRANSTAYTQKGSRAVWDYFPDDS